MYLCGLNQYCNYHGLSIVQKRPIHEERCGWREAKIQVQGMRLQLHGGEEVGRQVGGSAEAGAGPLPGRARLQGHREGARHKLRHGLPMDKEVGRASGVAGGRRARPGRRAGRAALLRTVKKTADGYGLLLIDLRENTSLLSAGTGAATQGRNSKEKSST